MYTLPAWQTEFTPATLVSSRSPMISRWMNRDCMCVILLGSALVKCILFPGQSQFGPWVCIRLLMSLPSFLISSFYFICLRVLSFLAWPTQDFFMFPHLRRLCYVILIAALLQSQHDDGDVDDKKKKFNYMVRYVFLFCLLYIINFLLVYQLAVFVVSLSFPLTLFLTLYPSSALFTFLKCLNRLS